MALLLVYLIFVCLCFIILFAFSLFCENTAIGNRLIDYFLQLIENSK